MSETAYNKTKLEHLTEYIVSHLNSNVLDNKIDAWQERAAIQVDGEDRGNGGHIAAYWRYEAVISIEEFPHRKLDPRNIFALIACWLTDYDSERDTYDLPDPELTVDVVSSEAADVLIEIEMIEPIEMIPDEQGMITWRNQKYRVQAVPIDVAEEYEMNHGH
ncbi:phage tail protein [Vibrio vulnificus]|uniref:tail terminator n=1 Tax=Vibrio phage PV94 TaxID=1451050 RepID=UPI0009B7002B|nr:phage tail protein [Vibrio vulnificus]YP_009948783.1 tail terminator [Vibrio phage PV94]EGR7975502.1 phage tail protein [Vibrio vulnificus]EJB0232231.1 phage tail protein [Vibrio vulnificus]EJN6711902.1 phage tail protein [Vibrio vulnificus]MCU8109203.1 phage tail protein [Vibrio vulnificus]MCU8130005.1 phage tail protein [Vibrio vulnificus]